VSECTRPFGLLFATEEIDDVRPRFGTYDERLDISVVELNGEQIPLVSAVTFRAETVTGVRREPTDQMGEVPSTPWSLSTETETKAERDYTQYGLEPDLLIAMATETTTRIAREPTD